MTRVIGVSDGRQVSVDSYGDPNGFPVFLLHGTPGSRSGPVPRPPLLYRLGIRLISYDRPGYGDSDRQQGRSVADAAADVLDIADHLELESFSVVGRSGGGPHAHGYFSRHPNPGDRSGVDISRHVARRHGGPRHLLL